MIVIFMTALSALAIALFVQARLAAREIRRHRRLSRARLVRELIL